MYDGWYAELDKFYLECFVEQKTAYEMRISDWSSDVCSSDLATAVATSPADKARAIRDARFATRGSRARGSARIWFAIPSSDDRLASAMARSEERCAGKECVSTCRTRWSSDHTNNKPTI